MSITRKLKVRWRKSREEETPGADVTRRRIEYFMLQPKAKAPRYLQPGEVVPIKTGGKWIRFKLLEMDRNQYRDSSYLWSMAKSDGEDITTYLVPGEEGSTTCSTWGTCL